MIKKYRINSKNILGHSDIAPDRKKDPGEKFPWKLLSKKKIGYWHNLNQNELIKNRNLKTSSKEKNLFLTIYLKLDIKKNFIQFKFQSHKFIKSFQKLFKEDLDQRSINGKIDQECLLISQNLVKKLINFSCSFIF